MTSGHLATAPVHPLLRMIAEVSAAVAEAGRAPAWTLSPAELVQGLGDLRIVIRQLEATESRMLREADRHQVGDTVGATTTASWWAQTTQATRREAHRQVGLAGRLDDDRPVSRAASGGEVSLDQAAVILDAIDALPTEIVDAGLRRDAETHLVELAAHHDPGELRILGRKIFDVIAPQIAEEHERRILENAERHAAATATFTMHPDGHGSMIGRFKIPTLAGEMLAKHLTAVAAPRHRHATQVPQTPEVSADRVSRPLRLGAAFVEYLETRHAAGVPKAGGIAATVVVTMTMADLLGEANKAALLDTGAFISAAEARRLACEAGIIPGVLGSKSQPLDVGRKTRFHTEPQRTALMLRDKGCAVEGCDWPPGMCHAHHAKPWSKGGPTTVHDGVLLCPRHHALAHDNRYQMKTSKNGRVTFTRRT